MSLFKSLDSVPKSTESSVKTIPKFTNVEYTVATFVNKLKEINTLSDKEIQSIIFRQYEMLLDYDLFLVNPESRQVAQQMFMNEKFLTNLIDCVPNLHLNEHQVICCNKLAYDYIAFHKASECNPTIRALLMELSFRVNLSIVLPLSAIIGLDSAKYLAMLRKSSFKEEKSVARVNRFLIRSGLELREQDMINIYSKLFERVTNLFIVTMFDIPEDDLNNLEYFRYDEMSKSMIDILDNMPSGEIVKVLKSYSNTYFLHGEPPVRFSMMSLHESYGRIKNVINELIEDGIIVP